MIGIERNGLDFITEDMLFLTPKILYDYPNKLQENEMKLYEIYLPYSNIRFLKNFCFSEGVKVERLVISSEDEYEDVLEKNIFSKIIRSFCLVQQITPDDVQKYFIFGITFNDFYITVILFD